MKKLIISLLLMALLVPICAHAVTRRISVPVSDEPFTDFLRRQVRGLAATDTAIISFGPGEFFIDGNVDILCNAEVAGAGRDKTRITVLKSDNKTDDCFFGFKPHLPATTSVWIHDLSMGLAPHEGLWWMEFDNRYLFKHYHVHNAVFERVDTYVDNAYVLNLDYRVCSNIVVRDCLFQTFNNCHAGGGISVRGDTRNVLIENNRFYKYGNDETLSFFGYSDDAYKKDSQNRTGRTFKENIRVVNNEFYAGGYTGKNPTDTVIDTYFTLNLFNLGDDQVQFELKDFIMENNKFVIDVPMHNLLTFTFDRYTHHANVRFQNNTIQLNPGAKAADTWYSDITVNDTSIGSDSIYIHNNSFITRCQMATSWRESAYAHICINGGKVSYRGNSLDALAKPSRFFASGTSGAILIQPWENGGSVSLTGNSFKGLYMLSKLNCGSRIAPVRITARKNSFDGDTRIMCHDVERLDLDFTDNTFHSTSSAFLLDTWAQTGSLRFSRNTVKVDKPAGALMTNWSGGDPSKMHFESLDVMGNRFYNVDPSQLLNNIRFVSKRYVSNNKFY